MTSVRDPQASTERYSRDGAQRRCAPTRILRCARLLVEVLFLVAWISGGASLAFAQRRPVLPQIDLPHPYYYREMYLPQLTSGPSSVAWSPDSREVVYSMAGSLWRQRVDSGAAVQLTDGPGYDYQPDWSPDGKSVVYCAYQKDAIELWLLDLATGTIRQLTEGGAVNVEPRWSPDGKRIVYVSTAYNKRFHIFAGYVRDGRLENIARLTEETKSLLPRYYYAAYDTEINPVWSPDGEEILFVSNRGHIYGTGGFWRMKAQSGAEAREIHYEETTWKARPDFSPDGTKIVYSSYLGRQWHQLWLLPAAGGDAFPISYGDWDETYARWSPDGAQLAFISNRSGNTELWLQAFPGGMQRRLAADGRKYLRPYGVVEVRVVGEDGKPTAARVSVTDGAGRFYAPKDAWISGDAGFDRSALAFETHYFASAGLAHVDVPAGKIVVEVMKGFEFSVERRTVEIRAGRTAPHATYACGAPCAANVVVKLRALPEPAAAAGAKRGGAGAAGRWVSSDLHVHMNYGGEYRNTPAHLVLQAEAENLNIVNNLIVNKEQRIPDIAYAGKQVDSASNARTLVVHGQEFHTTQWGHLDLLNIRGSILLPGYGGYSGTAAASLFPMDADVSDMAHAQGAVVGYAHPFDEDPGRMPRVQEDTPEEFAADVALGKVDYLEIVGFNDYRSTAEVWYRLLNLGFRISAGAGTDAMANFASLRGPVGLDRVYARVPPGPVKIEAFLEELRKGHTFATNGPLLDFSLGGEGIGGELKLNGPQAAVAFRAWVRSIVPVDHFELVCDGEVVQTFGAGKDALRKSGQAGAASSGVVLEASGVVAFDRSGWCLVRASSDGAEYPVLDNYVYATTSPIYVTIAGRKPRSSEDAKYFVDWMERVIGATVRYRDWNSVGEEELVMRRLREAKVVYEGLR
jgi:TolB protein